MTSCSIAPEDRRLQIQRVGHDLIEHHGKKDQYTAEEVEESHKRQGYNIDIVCWSHAVFLPHDVFAAHHRKMGEVCDYAAMKQEMLSAVSSSGDASWFNFDLSWLEFPDISSLFDL